MSNEQDKNVHPDVVKELLNWASSTFSKDDSASKVLRLHALTEHYLDRVLALHLAEPRLVTNDNRFTYHHKRCVTAAIGALSPDLIESLKRLSALRNKCAHSATPVVTAADILHAADPIRIAYDLAIADSVKDGKSMSEFNAYAWAIFTQLSLAVTPYEIIGKELSINT